jgi:hypothetical protein
MDRMYYRRLWEGRLEALDQYLLVSMYAPDGDGVMMPH